MAWNGTAYSSYSGGIFAYNDVAVQEGQYTFWAYEQLCYRSNYSGNGKRSPTSWRIKLLRPMRLWRVSFSPRCMWHGHVRAV